jgi:glyoxylase-like metal-dependent hydrolase (beta-lactamase superfamily II)
MLASSCGFGFAIPGTASAKLETAVPRRGEVMIKWELGDISLQRIIESEAPVISPGEIFPQWQSHYLSENRDWLVPRFFHPRAELLVFASQSFLVRRNGRTILIDTCVGNDKERKRLFYHRGNWPWLDRLRAAGIEPADVDMVLCSHLHVDHVGWNTKLENGKWVPTFPNARYLFSRREWEYWSSGGSARVLPHTGDYFSDSVLPVIASGQAELVEDEFAVDESIWLEPTPGHTPGHCAVHLRNGSSHALLTGDLIHHPLQVRYPDWSTRFCIDPDMARRSRRDFLDKHANSNILICPSHFPDPTGMFIQRDGADYDFKFAGEQHPIMSGSRVSVAAENR